MAFDIDEDDADVPDEGMAEEGALDMQSIAKDAHRYFEGRLLEYANKLNVQLDVCLQDLAHSILGHMLARSNDDIIELKSINITGQVHTMSD